jgi:hypothetical protein
MKNLYPKITVSAANYLKHYNSENTAQNAISYAVKYGPLR